MILLSKVFFVFANKLDNIVKVFNVVLFILFRAVANPADKVLNYMTLTFSDNLLVK